MNGIGFYGHDFFYIASDYELIAESIARIIMTNYNERVGRPFFGVNLRQQIFEQLDDESINVIKNNIRNQIADYEPRANITTLELTPDTEQNLISIKIGFKLIGDQLSDERFINLSFKLEN